jgi:hypothetical protein
VDYENIALMVVKVMKIPEPWIISIDRTDWKFGKTVFNRSVGKQKQGIEATSHLFLYFNP